MRILFGGRLTCSLGEKCFDISEIEANRWCVNATVCFLQLQQHVDVTRQKLCPRQTQLVAHLHNSHLSRNTVTHLDVDNKKNR